MSSMRAVKAWPSCWSPRGPAPPRLRSAGGHWALWLTESACVRMRQRLFKHKLNPMLGKMLPAHSPTGEWECGEVAEGRSWRMPWLQALVLEAEPPKRVQGCMPEFVLVETLAARAADFLITDVTVLPASPRYPMVNQKILA